MSIISKINSDFVKKCTKTCKKLPAMGGELKEYGLRRYCALPVLPRTLSLARTTLLMALSAKRGSAW